MRLKQKEPEFIRRAWKREVRKDWPTEPIEAAKVCVDTWMKNTHYARYRKHAKNLWKPYAMPVCAYYIDLNGCMLLVLQLRNHAGLQP